MADFLGHFLLCLLGLSMASGALMECLTPRNIGPVVFGWAGLMLTALTLAHGLNTIMDKVQ